MGNCVTIIDDLLNPKPMTAEELTEYLAEKERKRQVEADKQAEVDVSQFVADLTIRMALEGKRDLELYPFELKYRYQDFKLDQIIRGDISDKGTRLLHEQLTKLGYKITQEPGISNKYHICVA